jgi:endogenous inhibitor of DNA gyrase (YacG/DUF329 family)
MSMKHICPVCHKPVKSSSRDGAEETQFFPFCSRRCKLVDLGAWLDARYTIISSSRLQESGGVSNSATEGPSDRQ